MLQDEQLPSNIDVHKNPSTQLKEHVCQNKGNLCDLIAKDFITECMFWGVYIGSRFGFWISSVLGNHNPEMIPILSNTSVTEFVGTCLHLILKPEIFLENLSKA